MKNKPRARILSFLITLFICYSTGAAVAWQWNPGAWSYDARQVDFIICGVLVLIEQFVIWLCDTTELPGTMIRLPKEDANVQSHS